MTWLGPHAAPRDGWQHPWRTNDCPWHSPPVIAERSFGELRGALTELVADTRDPIDRAVSRLSLRSAMYSISAVLRRWAR